MEITSENFEAQFDLISESIMNAEFIAIDTEFSGSSLGINDRAHDYDTVEERYQKLRYTCQKFIAFQVGICTFHWDEKVKQYKSRPFSFYVFPKSQISDTVMMFQASAVNFLRKHNFDFNKLFKDAITYCPLQRKEELTKECTWKVTKTFPSLRGFTSLSTNHQQKLTEYMKQIDEWVYDPNSEETITFSIQSYSLKKALSKEITKVYLKTGVFTEFQRGQPETVIKKSKTFKQSKFMRGIIPSDDVSSVNSLGFQLNDEELKEEIEKMSTPLSIDPFLHDSQEKIEKSEITVMFEEELGFSRVIQLIMDCKKPLVGHNMMYDLGFIYRQFVSKDGSLPTNYDQFTKAWKTNFRQKIYDTKVFAAHCGQDMFGKTSLDLVYAKCEKDKTLRNNVSVGFDTKTHEIFGSYGAKNTTSNQAHDAGFDAYMTGKVFIFMSKYIEIGKIVKNSKGGKLLTQKGNQILTQTTAQSKGPALAQGAEILSQQPRRPRKMASSQQHNSEEEEKSQSGYSDSSSSSRRNVKHYSSVQNKPIYYEDLDEFENKIMLSIDIPRFFYLDKKAVKSSAEVDYEKRMKENVIFVTFKQILDAKAIAELFNVYGDINVVKSSDLQCFIEFSFVDKNLFSQYTKIQDLIKKAEQDIKNHQRGLLSSIKTFDNADRFYCEEDAIEPFYKTN